MGVAAAVFFSTVGVTPAVVASLGPGGLAALRAVAGPLFAYAVAFNALPAARARAERRRLGRRGAERAAPDAARSFDRPSRRLREKLAARAAQRQRSCGGGGGASVYSTADDARKIGAGAGLGPRGLRRRAPGAGRRECCSVLGSLRVAVARVSRPLHRTFYISPHSSAEAAHCSSDLKANSRTRKIP